MNFMPRFKLGAFAVILSMFLPLLVRAESLTIGFLEKDSSANWLASEELLPVLIRSLVTPSFIVSKNQQAKNSGQGFLWKFVGIRGIVSEKTGVRLDLRPGLFFSSGSEVREADLNFSLWRCFGDKQKSAKVRTYRELFEGKTEAAIYRMLSICPLLESESSQVFSTDLGFGTNAVGIGAFYVSQYRPQKEITLLPRGSSKPKAIDKLIFKGFSEGEAALSGLRIGELDLAIGLDSSLDERILADETLAFAQCPLNLSTYRVVKRKSSAVDCL